MRITYVSRQGRHRLAVVHIPDICGQRFVHLLQDGQESWVLRDFICGYKLRRARAPNPSFSNFDLAQIEALVVDCESTLPDQVCTADAFWRRYLRRLSTEKLNSISLEPPSPAFGDWKPL